MITGISYFSFQKERATELEKKVQYLENDKKDPGTLKTFGKMFLFSTRTAYYCAYVKCNLLMTVVPYCIYLFICLFRGREIILYI